MLKLIKNDPWLSPYSHAIEGRHNYAVWRENNWRGNGLWFARVTNIMVCIKDKASVPASGPNATDIFLVGDLTIGRVDAYDCIAWTTIVIGRHMPYNLLKHGQHYKMRQVGRRSGWPYPGLVSESGAGLCYKIFSAQVGS